MQIIRTKDDFMVIKLAGMTVGSIQKGLDVYSLTFYYGKGLKQCWPFEERDEMFQAIRDRIVELHDELILFLESEEIRLIDQRENNAD